MEKVVHINFDIWQVDYQNDILEIPFGFVNFVKILFCPLKVIVGVNNICGNEDLFALDIILGSQTNVSVVFYNKSLLTKNICNYYNVNIVIIGLFY